MSPVDEPVEVGWEEVARYVLAVERSKASDRSIHDELRQLRQKGRDELERMLEPFRGNRAANNLLDEELIWFRQRLPLGELRIRGGTDHSSKRMEIAKRYGGKPQIEEFADELRQLPSEEWDDSVRAFRFDPANLREGVDRLVAYQEPGEPDRWYLGDGYHRGVAFFLDGRRDVEVYAGVPGDASA